MKFIWNDETNLDECQKPFEKRISKIKPKERINRYGEGIEDVSVLGSHYGYYGHNDVKSFNMFYDQFIDRTHSNEVEKIKEYRNISRYTEISDVVEEIVDESTQVDLNGNKLQFDVTDEDLKTNTNIVETLNKEFTKLFFNRLNINKKLDEFLSTYYIDGRIYFENIIDASKPKNGIINIKKLPTETMDFVYDPIVSEIQYYVQYLSSNTNKTLPYDIKDLEKEEQVNKLVTFYPNQISYIDYGIYGDNGKKDVLGYLEKVKQPYNQVKLLETSVVIYRLVRAPERLVFTIDVGNMPPKKADKYVEEMKRKLQKRISYDPTSGKVSEQANVMSMLENFFLPQSADGRGSSIDSIGGNPSGFAELDDLYYFQRKLYKALKYPMSRVDSKQEKANRDIIFSSGNNEIVRDETKWGRFLKKHQDKFCELFIDLFILHLDLIGLKSQYELDRSKISITMTVPNNYIAQMQQMELEQKWDNYSRSNEEEFPKSWRMKKFLKLTDEEIKEIAEHKQKDIELGFASEDDGGNSRW